MRLEFEGLDELVREIDRIDGVTESLKDQALIAGGDLLQQRVKAEVYSHGLNRQTGQAQESIVRTDPKDGTLFVGTQGGKKKPGFYLYMHEVGYYNVRAGRFMAPKPLMSIVYQNSKSDILETYASVFRRGLGM